MSQDHCAPLLIELKRRGDIGLSHSVTAAEELQKEGNLIRGFAVLHIDLSCYSLKSVDYRRGTLGNLDTLKPLAGNISKTERRCQSPHHRSILIQ